MPTSSRELQFVATDAAHFLTPILQEKLRELAETSGWPTNVVNALVVDFDGNNLSIKYPDEMSDEIDDLEYGKPFGLPNSVIRSFVYNSEPYIKEVLVSRTLDLILDASEVF